ncbi:chemotaxis protein CheW [Ekhidna sp.]|uniref:chemotaxis protein CheW n=1 Tax=Ekhidna sp. TaxID=2608089 RepID=UPI003B50EDA0
MALGKNLSKQETTDTLPKTSETSEKEPTDQNESVETGIEQDSETDEENSKNLSFDQYCVFSAGGEEYAFPINLVREVVPYPSVSFVPHLPSYITGMANVRGNIYGILDLNIFFKVKTKEKDEYKYLLVLDDDNFQMGIAIPEVPNTLMVSNEMIEKLASARLKSTIGQKYLKGIIKKDGRMIILFDILGVISSDKFTAVT